MKSPRIEYYGGPDREVFARPPSGMQRRLSPVPSQKLWNHSPDGFNYGYGGSGPAQLALAILLDFTGDKQLALGCYQDFKWQFIAPLEQGKPWRITGSQIEEFLAVAAAK